jgi:hypothetical protein
MRIALNDRNVMLIFMNHLHDFSDLNKTKQQTQVNGQRHMFQK